ncbi:helix-turn-helix transcriptional regulator [Dactylosporangium sp. NPDC051485]|uniref:helix-turn-helix domain-containing protein n=1 Tax=Dactylosporangium sp. NPDC051485 TaxID=3154846 RepID=UPI003439DF87
MEQRGCLQAAPKSRDSWTVDDLGVTLRRARQAAGQSLAGMAKRTGFSRSYLGNAETGERAVTPAVIRAYEKVLGDDLNRRELLIGAVSALAAVGVPDEASDIATSVRAERYHLLASAQTSHAVDKTIAALFSQDTPSLAALTKWAQKGTPVLRVNASGILAKIGSPVLDGQVARWLVADVEVRELYVTAVVSRVLGLPWDDARQLARSGFPLAEQHQLDALTAEVTNTADAGAHWCSIVLLARTRPEARTAVDDALTGALKTEISGEHLRAIGYTLAGLDPIAV